MNTQKRRTALVTGGATGIGKAITLKLFEEGFNVVVAEKAVQWKLSSYLIWRIMADGQ